MGPQIEAVVDRLMLTDKDYMLNLRFMHPKINLPISGRMQRMLTSGSYDGNLIPGTKLQFRLHHSNSGFITTEFRRISLPKPIGFPAKGNTTHNYCANFSIDELKSFIGPTYFNLLIHELQGLSWKRDPNDYVEIIVLMPMGNYTANLSKEEELRFQMNIPDTCGFSEFRGILTGENASSENDVAQTEIINLETHQRLSWIRESLLKGILHQNMSLCDADLSLEDANVMMARLASLHTYLSEIEKMIVDNCIQHNHVWNTLIPASHNA